MAAPHCQGCCSPASLTHVPPGQILGTEEAPQSEQIKPVSLALRILVYQAKVLQLFLIPVVRNWGKTLVSKAFRAVLELWKSRSCTGMQGWCRNL